MVPAVCWGKAWGSFSLGVQQIVYLHSRGWVPSTFAIPDEQTSPAERMASLYRDLCQEYLSNGWAFADMCVHSGEHGGLYTFDRICIVRANIQCPSATRREKTQEQPFHLRHDVDGGFSSIDQFDGSPSAFTFCPGWPDLNLRGCWVVLALMREGPATLHASRLFPGSQLCFTPASTQAGKRLRAFGRRLRYLLDKGTRAL